MLRWAKTFSRVVIVTAMVLVLLPRTVTYADGTCSATVTPNSAAPTASTTFTVKITNTGATDIQWADIAVPSANFHYDGHQIFDWSAGDHETGVTVTANTIAPGQAAEFTVMATAGLRNVSSGLWQIQASDDPGGANPAVCTGSPNTSISGHPPNSADNGVSAIMVTNITTTSATIIWESSSPTTSLVYYGKTSSYGSASSYNTDHDNNHSVTITGLSAGTGYHFQVAGDDGAGTFAYSGNNTFVTKAAPVVSGPNPGPAPAGSAPIKATPTERVPPQITLSTSLTKPVKTAPEISGAATDNDGVARLEYSTDGGQNWLSVDKMTGIGGKSATFKFTPTLIDDGNYVTLARATDLSGNQAVTSPATLIIDQLPPQVGALVVGYGSGVLVPDDRGALNVVAGSDYKVTTSGVGGPISLMIEAQLVKQTAAAASTYAFTQSAETGLWNGLMSFKTGGIYQLTARSLDGAGNKTSRLLMTLNVTESGQVREQKTDQPLASAKLTLYYLEPSSHTWQVWDGAPYGQANPQVTKADGRYSLMVPEGEYYVRVQAPLHEGFVSDIVKFHRPTGLTAPIALKPAPHMSLGPFKFRLPDLVWNSRPLALAAPTPDPGAGIVGMALPDFNLPTTDGGTKRALGLSGRPTVLSMLTTWSPDSQNQLAALAAAQTNRNVNITPVFSQERLHLVSTYLDTAGYELAALVDADGVLVPSLQVGSLPQHVFIDREGRIKKVMVGVLSKDEVLLELGGL